MAQKNAAREALPSGLDPRLTLQTVVRTMGVLEAIGRVGRPLSLAEIAAEAGIDRSAAQRIAHTLQGLGYLARGEADTGYVPGRRLLHRCFDYLRMSPLIERATPVLIDLRKTTRERVDLSFLEGTEIVYAIRQLSKRETFFATLIGRRVPTCSSSGGRAMMALMEDHEVDDIIARSTLRPLTRRTIHDRDGIWAKVREARADGYACALEETLMGEIVLAAAITDRDGRPVAAVHIAGSLGEWAVEDFRGRFAPLALEAARALGH